MIHPLPINGLSNRRGSFPILASGPGG
jgi:hypothetical protein